MSDRFVTAYHPAGFKQYGRSLVDGFNKYSNGWELHAYVSDMWENYSGCYEPIINSLVCVEHEQFDIAELDAFLSRHKNNAHVHGKKDHACWKDKDRQAGYSYRTDMYKFCRMIYVMWAEAHRDPTGRMIWLDGDCQIRKMLPDDFIDRALPEGFAYSYLGRSKKYSETGFLVFDLPNALPVLDEWARFCSSDSFLDQPEQHSAFLFDRAREKHPDIKGYNLTPDGGGHPIYDCFVGEWIHHLKGSRKNKGFCPQGQHHEKMLTRVKKR